MPRGSSFGAPRRNVAPRKNSSWFAPLGAALALVLGGCGRDEGARTGFEVRDSAGVGIASSPRPSWSEGAAWTVGAEPVVRIGALDGDEAYLLNRVVAPTRLSDGRFAVANTGTQQVRYYDSLGIHLQSVGGPGRGPGEYQGLARIFRMPGDSLFALDVLGARFTILAPDGSVARTHAVDLQRAAPRGRMDNGRLVMLPVVGQRMSQGYSRPDVALTLSDVEGSREDTLGIFAGNESFLIMVQSQTGTSVSSYVPPFSRSLQLFVSGGRFYLGSGDRAEIEVRGADGAIERIIRYGVEPRPVRSGDVDRWRTAQLERATNPSVRPAVEQFVREVAVPATMPFYSLLQEDLEGNLWVREYTPPGESTTRWDVFNQEGRWLGPVNLPEGVTISEIGRDYVLGVYRDDLGVESVVMHPLRKS